MESEEYIHIERAGSRECVSILIIFIIIVVIVVVVVIVSTDDDTNLTSVLPSTHLHNPLLHLSFCTT